MDIEATLLTTPDGRRLEAFAASVGAPIALLFHHGTPSSGLPFAPRVDALAQRGLRHISFSRPGYGSSTRRPGRTVADDAQDAARVLDHVEADDCYVIGWSGGAPHALATAALLPQRVRGVALIGGVAPYPAEGLDYTAGMGAENVEEFGRALTGPGALIEWMGEAWPAYRDITGAQIADGLGSMIDEVDRGALTGEFAEWMAASMRAALRDGCWGWFDDDMAFVKPWGFDLADIRVPVHVWQGGHDRMVPFAHGRWLADHLPTACAHLLPEHGHLTLGVDAIADIADELLAR